MMFKRGKVKKFGQTEPITRANTRTVRSMATEFIFGEMEVNLMETGKITK